MMEIHHGVYLHYQNNDIIENWLQRGDYDTLKNSLETKQPKINVKKISQELLTINKKWRNN